MARALQGLGVEIADDGADWVLSPGPLLGPARVECGLAGTVMRFLPSLAALADGNVRFDGAPRARERPLRPLLQALTALGVDVDDGGRGALPFTVAGKAGAPGGSVAIDASASSQFVSALLLSGARYERGVDVRHRGQAMPSRPHLAMTVEQLRLRGVTVDDEESDRWVVRPGPIAATDTAIEPDLSTAAPFAAAAVATGGRVTLVGWPRRTTQAGDRLRRLLPQLGAWAELTHEGLVVSGDGELVGIDADLRDVGELAPVLAALGALAATPSRLRGIAHLRGHESDRLTALVTELNRLGGSAAVTDDGLTIDPRPLRGGAFRTYGDHRMAHAGAVLALRTPEVWVDDIDTTAKTHPDFVAAWTALVR